MAQKVPKTEQYSILNTQYRNRETHAPDNLEEAMISPRCWGHWARRISASSQARVAVPLHHDQPPAWRCLARDSWSGAAWRDSVSVTLVRDGRRLHWTVAESGIAAVSRSRRVSVMLMLPWAHRNGSWRQQHPYRRRRRRCCRRRAPPLA